MNTCFTKMAGEQNTVLKCNEKPNSFPVCSPASSPAPCPPLSLPPVLNTGSCLASGVAPLPSHHPTPLFPTTRGLSVAICYLLMGPQAWFTPLFYVMHPILTAWPRRTPSQETQDHCISDPSDHLHFSLPRLSLHTICPCCFWTLYELSVSAQLLS